MLVDDVSFTLIAGHGGAGKVSFSPRAGADGGNGGRGGDVVVVSTSDLSALNRFTRQDTISADNGVNGGSNRITGKTGSSVEIRIPIGTTLVDTETGEQWEVDSPEQNFIICTGGLGGQGNFEFKSSRHTTPTYAQPGLPGQQRVIHAVLKFIADYGLVGLPNAGKSSLLNELTNAKAAVGAYPFTTLEAGLGVCRGKVIADIPGLIEGASQGRGLGHKFLKHIEKVKTILHCISCESTDIVADFRTINSELSEYSSGLSLKPRLLLLTKSDLVDSEALNAQCALLGQFNYPIFPVSIHDPEQIDRLVSAL